MHSIPARFVAALSALAAPCLAQAQLDAAESAALALKARGEYRAAQTAFAEILRNADGDALAAARAEYAASVAQILATRNGDFGFARQLREFAGGAFAARHPSLHDHCLQLALDLARTSGDHTTAAELTAELGYVGRWMFVGPFDNERGSGYARQFGPETEFDLDRTYDGKKRPVQWRACPVDDPVAGRIDCNAMFRPADQVLCYAATAVIVEDATDATLWLGSDEAVKIFVNGREVFGRDLRRLFAPDQDVVPLRLHAGANLLTVKLCEQEGRFEFAARIRALDGRPLDGVRISAQRADLVNAAATDPVEGDAPTPRPRGLDVLTDSVAKSGNARDALRLGMLLGLLHPDDPNDRRDHEYAKRAAAALPDEPAARYLLAFTRVREGRSEERDENARRQDYLDLIAAVPEHAEALRSLAQLELESTKNATHALTLADRALAVHADFAAARLVRADALAALDLAPLADLEATRAAATGAPIAVARRMEQLRRRSHWHQAADYVDTRLAARFDAGATTTCAEVLLRIGDQARAIAILERAIAHLPFERGPRRRLARVHEANGDLDTALKTLGSWLSICPEDDDVLVDLARLHGIRGDLERQCEMLRTAVELNPNRKDERRYLDFLVADEKPFYEGFTVEVDAASFAQPTPEDSVAQNAPFHYLLEHELVRAYRNGTTSRYHHQVVRIASEQGARDMTAFAVPHFWGEQRARLLSVRVVKASGEELRPAFSGSYVRIPPLAPGDTCEFRYRVDDLAPTFFGEYFGLEHSFAAADGSSVGRSVLDLILEPGRNYRLQARNGAPEPTTRTGDDGATIHRFEMRDLRRRKLEERRPALEETEPLVRVTTYQTWNEFSSWWWNLIRKQTEVTPAMRAKVAELTRGLDDEVAKIDALYRFVTTDIRYKAWEFGVHGYKPYSTPVIFERRHGDCKDKALLLNALLGEVGIEAFPVLIYADPLRSTDDLTLPMVQHFNHCISYLPPKGDRAAMFLDGTATYHPVDTLPDMDQGAEVLVVEPERGELLGIPWVTAEQNTDARRFDVRLEADGSATVTVVHEPRRNQAVWVRDSLGNEPAKRRELLERELTARFGAVEIRRIETSDLLDLGQPVRLEIEFRCEQFARIQDGALVLEPGLTQRSMQSLTTATEREFPLLTGIPERVTQDITYRLPDGFAPVEVPAPIRIDRRFGDFDSTWSSPDASTLQVQRTRSLHTNRIEPQEYPEFRDFAAELDRADLRVVLVKRKDS